MPLVIDNQASQNLCIVIVYKRGLTESIVPRSVRSQ